ncbi:LysR family transcriptional regulator [uncultured Roseobacter sp.]|uniref:LysR family transcriptional regulator n=1 Tax=uncultured Roseobacter sp. TaxID=114847 RepID=UPI00261BAD7B|nr:LysR family transcriptional regulator [uncultured Roseobacter sp.]
MDSIQSLRTFVTVAETGSFAAAARRLDLSTSATSKSVARLEAVLGVQLFRRTTRSVALTPEGERLLEGLRPVLRDLDALRRDMATATKAPAGRLTVSAPAAFGRMTLIPKLAGFRRDYPDVELELRFEDNLVDLVSEQVDVAIRAGNLNDSTSLIARYLFDDQLVTCAAPTYLDRKGFPQVPDDLDGHDCLAFRNTATGRAAPWFFRDGDELMRLTPDSPVTSNDGESIAQAAIAGLGMAQMPSYMAAAALADGRVIEVLEACRPPPTPFHAVFLDRRLMPSRLRVFIDFLAGTSRDRTGLWSLEDRPG